MLIVVDSNVTNTIDFIQQFLHLALICFDEIFKHLSRAKRYLKVMRIFLEIPRHIAFIYFMANPNIGTERIVGLPQKIQRVSGRRSVKLRRMMGNKVFGTTKVAY